jgi:flagellar motor switch protein FliG
MSDIAMSEGSIDPTATVDQSRLQAFLERLPLPLRLRTEQGKLDYADYSAGADDRGAPALAALAGSRGKLTLFGSRVADASIREGNAPSVELSNPAFIMDAKSVEEYMLGLRFPVRVEVGTRLMSFEEASELAHGSLVTLDRIAGEALDLVIEEPRRRIGRGEAVVINGSYGLRLTEASLPEISHSALEEPTPRAPRIEARLTLGRARIALRDMLALGAGSVIQLVEEAGSPARLELGDEISLAASVAVVDESYCAKILEGAVAESAVTTDEPESRRRIDALEEEIQSLGRGLDDGIASLRSEIRDALAREAELPRETEASQASSPSVDPALAAAISACPDGAARGLSALCSAGRQIKAALALVALGRDTAAEIFKRLRQDEIEVLTFEIARIETADREELASAVAELASFVQGEAALASGGIDYAREILEKSLGSQGAIDVINRLTASLQVRPFDFIRQADPQRIRKVLAAEHPQTIACIASFLEPIRAAIVIEGLPYRLQSEVVKRIATMEEVSCETLREIERVLERAIGEESDGWLAAGGVDSAVEILDFIGRASEKGIIESLESESPDLALAIKKRMFVFDDIVLLDDRAVQKALRELDSQTLAKALRGCGPDAREKIFKNMSKRAVMMLKEDMEFMGPVRLAEVEAAQQRFVEIIRKLEEQGEIIIARGESENLV